MNNTALVFVLSVSANFREQFCAHLKCSFMCPLNHETIKHNLEEDSIHCLEMQSCRWIFDSTASYRQQCCNTAYTVWCKEQDTPILGIWQNSPVSHAATFLQGYSRNWLHSERHWILYFHYSQSSSLIILKGIIRHGIMALIPIIVLNDLNYTLRNNQNE